jgi:flagellar basal-body rod protein FlgF/flagellar basal-body rod protein FlgG
MENTLLVGLSRQVAIGRQLDVVSNNIANLNTSGFKADGSLFEEYIAPLARENGFRNPDRAPRFVQDRGIWHDMGQGTIQQTGNPLDIALEGDGFFTVQTPAGERYTRNGGFQINANGQLVTNEGMPVLGDNGPIVLQPTDSNVMISKDGRVTVTEGSNTRTEGFRGRIRVVRFARPHDLIKEGASSFRAPIGMAAIPVATPIMHQASLEKSNVNGVTEMTRLIDINRSYTQIASLLQQQGEMRRSAIQQLADVPA